MISIGGQDTQNGQVLLKQDQCSRDIISHTFLLIWAFMIYDYQKLGKNRLDWLVKENMNEQGRDYKLQGMALRAFVITIIGLVMEKDCLNVLSRRLLRRVSQISHFVYVGLTMIGRRKLGSVEAVDSILKK